MNPLLSRQLEHATGDGGRVDLGRLLAQIAASYDKAARQRARAVQTGRRLLRELHAANRRFFTTVENVSLGICWFDPEERLIISNRQYAALYRIDPASLRPGIPITELFALRRAAGSLPDIDSDWYRKLSAFAKTATEAFTTSYELQDGRIVQIRQQPMPDGGWVSTHEDVTETRKSEARISHMALHDALTGCANRVQLRQFLAGLSGEGGITAVLGCDLDRFKEVNDTLGHAAGDQLLQQVAERLGRHTRRGDLLARVGGDEFVVVAPGVMGAADAAGLAERMIGEIAAPFTLGENAVFTGLSVGIALRDTGGAADPDALLHAADLALYEAKRGGRGRFCLFEPSLENRVSARKALEREIWQALEGGQFRFEYEPVWDRDGGRVGAEALLHWRHPERGEVAREVFIPVANEQGVGEAAGIGWLEAACRGAARWQAGRLVFGLPRGVLGKPGFAAKVAAILADTGLAPARLELGIQEAELLRDTERRLEALRALKALGVRLLLERLGTGATQLAALCRFPLDSVRLDAALAAENPPLARGIVALAHAIGLEVLAAGVLGAAQAAWLRALGCDALSGAACDQPA